MVRHARDLGLIVAFTIRMVDSRPRSWMDLSEEWRLANVLPVIREVPDAKYFVLNVSNGMMVKDEDRSIIKESQILFDTSGKNISNLGELINIFGKNKFAFGSHSPILDYLTGLLRIEALREEEADETVKEMLRSGNARSFLGL